MKNNLKIDDIDIIVTNDSKEIFGSLKLKAEAEELIQQGPGWSVIAFSKTKSFGLEGLKKLKRLISKMIWLKSGKTRNLRDIIKNIKIDNKELWNEAYCVSL